MEICIIDRVTSRFFFFILSNISQNYHLLNNIRKTMLINNEKNINITKILKPNFHAKLSLSELMKKQNLDRNSTFPRHTN